MSPSDEIEVWRKRFILMNLVRIGGTLVVLLGLYIWHSDWLGPRGMPAVGFPLALIGLGISFGAPKWLAKQWATPPE